MFLMDVLNSIKKANRLRKEINRIFRKGMSNIYLKITIEKNWRSQNFENFSQGQFWEAATHEDITQF